MPAEIGGVDLRSPLSGATRDQIKAAILEYKVVFQHPWIVGLDRDESRELLSIVHDQYRKPDYQVRFSWRPGSIAFWDNRAAVHYAVRNYGDFPRLLERILIADEPQYADL